MAKFFIFTLLVFLSQNIYAKDTFKTWQFLDYVVLKESVANGNKIVITKRNLPVFEIVNVVQPDWVVAPEIIINRSKNQALVMIKNYSGGARCCYDTIVFELGKKFSEVAKFKGYVEFNNLDKNSDLEAVVSEEYSQWTPFSGAIYGKAILRYQNGSYVLASDLMVRQFSQSQIDAIISKIKTNYYNFVYVKNVAESVGSKQFSNQNLQTANRYFSKLLPYVIDLIYSGNDQQALMVIDKTWPGSKLQKDQFLQDLTLAIKSKEYGQKILGPNGLEFAQPALN